VTRPDRIGPQRRPRLGAARAVTTGVTAIAVGGALLGAVLSAGHEDGSRGAGYRAERLFRAFPEYELDLLRFAHVKITAACMMKAGYAQPSVIAISPPTPEASHLQVTLASIGPPTGRYARTYGFGSGGGSDWEPPQLDSPDERSRDLLADCRARAWRTIGVNAQAVHARYTQLSGIMRAEYRAVMAETQKREDLNTDLAGCLSDAGYSVLDRDAFLENPFPGHFGIKTADMTPAGSLHQYRPTPEEAEFAVAFARCNRTTGRLQRLAARSPQAQDQVMRAHEVEMTRLNGELVPLAHRAAALTGLL
jgi:hypothetical protein